MKVNPRAATQALQQSWQAIEAVLEDIGELGDRVVAIVNRRLRGRGSGIEVEGRIAIVSN